MCVLFRRDMPWFQMSLPVQVRSSITPFFNRLHKSHLRVNSKIIHGQIYGRPDLHLIGSPGVQIDGLYFADMRAHATMDARTADA
jgi:hypothetical protein